MQSSSQARPAILLIVESGIDVRTVDGLAERFELTILARRIEGGVEISRPPSQPVTVHVGPASRTRFAIDAFRAVRSSARNVQAVIVQNYGAAALAANLAARSCGLRCYMHVCNPMETYYSCRKQASSGRRYRRGEAAALDLAARANALVGQHYLVLSDYLADVVRARAPRKPVSLVRTYGVDTAVFRPPVECRRVIRERRGLPTGGAIIFFSSRVAPEKDAETLLEAFAQLRHQGRDLWLLHRSGGYREFLRLAEQYAVTDRVIATDAVHPVTELPLDYQCSDLCVQASRAEGLGFSPLEALACGTPVVAASVGGLKETIIEGCTGWTYPPGDAATLARQIEAALSDPAEARRRTVAGRALVLDRFERTLVFDQLERIILAGKDAPLRSMKQGGSA